MMRLQGGYAPAPNAARMAKSTLHSDHARVSFHMEKKVKSIIVVVAHRARRSARVQPIHTDASERLGSLASRRDVAGAGLKRVAQCGYRAHWRAPWRELALRADYEH